VTLLESVVLADVVKVITANDNGFVHLHLGNNTRENAAMNKIITAWGALCHIPALLIGHIVTFVGIVTWSWCSDGTRSRPIVVEMGELVRQFLNFIRSPSQSVMHHNVMSGVNGSLSYKLRHKEEVIEILSGHSMIKDSASRGVWVRIIFNFSPWVTSDNKW